MSEQAEPVSIHEWVDDIADQFEKAWQGMKPPMVNEFLGEADGERRAALLAELIQIDLAYRARLGDCRQVGDYYHEFPELRNLPTPDFVSPTPVPKTFHPPVSKGGNAANKSWPNIPGYEILGELGHGGMGVVYKARQDRLKRVVALKMISPGKQAGEWEQSRFRTEMEAVARLQHPNIVQIYEVGEQDGRQYCALEYVEGFSLAQWLTGTPQSGQEAAYLVESLGRAVYYAHQQGIIHRDLKPGNVMLGVGVQRSTVRDPQKTDRSLLSSIPKIADFGLAKRLDATAGAEQTRTGEILGTPSYMAPEQAEGKTSIIGPGADIYSLGAILYELLSGRPPFKGESTLDTLMQVRSQEPVAPSRLQPKVPRDLETICLKAMAKSPDRRYGTADELANDLRRFLDGKPILARPVSQVEKLWRWGKRNPVVAALSATVLMVLLAGAVVSMFFAVRAEQGAKDARRNLYGSHMNLAQRYWQEGQIHEAMALLGKHEPMSGAADERCWEWHYLSRLCRTDARTLEGHTGAVNALAFSPDGRRLASGGRAVWLWDVASGTVLHKLASEVSGAVTSLAFSPDTRLLAWVGSGEVYVWSLADNQMLSTFPGGSCLAFSSDSRFLASNRAEGGILEVWNPVTGKLLFHLEGHGNLVSSLAFSPDGRWLVSASDDQTVKLWDLAARKVVRMFRGHRGHVSAVAFSPDGHRLGSAGHDQTARIWDVVSGRVLHILKGHGSEVNRIAFSPSGQQFASACGDHTIKLWDVAGGEELATFRGHKSGVSSVVFSPDGRQLASAGDDGIIKLWDAAGDQEAHIRTGHSGASFSPDGRYLAAPGPGRTVKVWDLTGLQVMQILKGHSHEVWAVAFSPDSCLLAAASGVRKQKKWVSGEVTLWDTQTWRAKYTIRGHSAGVFSVAFSPDGRRFASGSRDGTVKVWDTTSGQEIHSFQHHPRPGTDGKTAVHQVAFHPDGKLLASASDDFTVKVWDTDQGRELRTLDEHTSYVYSVAFNSDGRHLAAVEDHKTIKIWEISSGRLIHNLFGHTGPVTSVTFHPYEQRLITGDNYGTIKIWDSATGQELCTLKGHTKQVWGLAFSPDGYRLASGSEDETVRLWDARPLTPELAEKRDAMSLVEFLFSKLLPKEEVIANIRADQTVTEPVRQQALAIAQRACEDPDRFTGASWSVACLPRRSTEKYQQALGWAETACRLDPERETSTMLGAALYRVGRYKEALAKLTRSTEINAEESEGPSPHDLAFLSMTQHHLGQNDNARSSLASLRGVMGRWPGNKDKDALALWSEAEELIMGEHPEPTK